MINHMCVSSSTQTPKRFTPRFPTAKKLKESICGILYIMLKQFSQAFGYALNGLKLAWIEGMNFKIQVVCAFLAGALGLFLHISALEFCIVILAISSVLAAEAFNTALEELCDKFQPTHDPHIAKIKDLAAAAVLLTSVGTLVIGLVIFLPYLW